MQSTAFRYLFLSLRGLMRQEHAFFQVESSSLDSSSTWNIMTNLVTARINHWWCMNSAPIHEPWSCRCKTMQSGSWWRQCGQMIKTWRKASCKFSYHFTFYLVFENELMIFCYFDKYCGPTMMKLGMLCVIFGVGFFIGLLSQFFLIKKIDAWKV